jgi:hypothetical protein
MKHEGVDEPGVSLSLIEVPKATLAVILMANSLQRSIASRKYLSEAESNQNLLTGPQTPRKIPCLGLDYSTPRQRYGGKCTLPLTPEYTPSKRSKRTFENALEDMSFYSQSAKRRHTYSQTFTPRSLVRQESLSKFSFLPRAVTLNQIPFSADEMKRTCEGMLNQVNWNEVQEYVASNRSAASYRKAMKAVLQAEVDRLFEEEDNSDDDSTD